MKTFGLFPKIPDKVFLLLLCASFAACGDDGTEPEPQPVAVQSVSLDKPTITLTVGENETLTATVSPADADNKAVTWSASSAGIVKVEKIDDTKAKITALAESAQPATVTVTTTDGGKTKTCAVTVNPIPTYGISHDAGGSSYHFPEAIEGYAAQTPKTITITNTSNQPTGALTVALSGDDAESFTVSTTSITNIAVGGTATFTVVPKTDLAADDHSATLMITGAHDISAGFSVVFRVAKYAISLSQTEAYTFPEATAGYGAQTAKEITVTNTGNRATGELAIALTGDNAADYFAVSPANITDIAPDGTATFSITPKTGLAAGTYTATVAVSGANNIAAGFDVSFTVNSYSIALSQTGPYTFPEAEKGYAAQTPKEITVTNTGSKATGGLTVALSGAGAADFTLSKTAITEIAPTETATFTIAPNVGLAVGTYTATVTVSGANGISAGFGVSFTVTDPPSGLWTDGVTANAAATFSGGDGTSADTPYIIATPADLVQLAVNVNSKATNYNGKYFELTADIDLAGKYWIPIGLVNAFTSGFQGRFDGGGHVVRNMTIDDREYEYLANYTGYTMSGLFGWTYYAYIKNLGLENGTMYLTRTKFGNAGLLVAFGDQIMQFENCWATGTINVAAGTYDSDNLLGGLIGQTYSQKSPKNCYFIGRIVCDANTGSLGGLLGNNRAANSVNCYAVAGIETTDVTKVFAFSDTKASNCYFDSTIYSGTDGSGATGKTTAEMKSAAMATLLNNGGAAWAYDAAKNGGYPYLVAVPPGN